MQKRSGTRDAGSRRTGRRAALGQREKRRLLQLAVCAALFLVVFLGRGAAPDEMAGAWNTLWEVIRSDTDFQGAFSAAGEAISRGEPVLESLGRLAVEVFGAGSREAEESGGMDSPAAQAALRALTVRPTSETMLRRLGAVVPERTPAAAREPAEPSPSTSPSPSPTPQVPAYTGLPLPEGATMDYVDLGLGETVTPVMGALSSPYGYRDHPVSGEYLFHCGVDLAADVGTPVLAFAAGTVEFVGESDEYGLYIQLDHANGVKTFYCHCSAVYAQTGQSVAAGQAIAAVGETGNATGPHLHLEVKRDGVLLNPSYYVETAG